MTDDKSPDHREGGGEPSSLEASEGRKGIIVMPMDVAPQIDVQDMAPTGLPPAEGGELQAAPPPDTPPAEQ
jgi:hypothetical protein